MLFSNLHKPASQRELRHGVYWYYRELIYRLRHLLLHRYSHRIQASRGSVWLEVRWLLVFVTSHLNSFPSDGDGEIYGSSPALFQRNLQFLHKPFLMLNYGSVQQMNGRISECAKKHAQQKTGKLPSASTRLVVQHLPPTE